MCAICAKDHGLLDTDGWKGFCSLAKRAQKMPRMVKPFKLRPHESSKKHMCGFEIPAVVMMLSNSTSFLHGDDKWQGATKLEMGQLHERNAFHDKGIGTTPGEEIKKNPSPSGAPAHVRGTVHACQTN
jgi:hypothetical protein